MATMRPRTGMRTRERGRKIEWLRRLRERLQHFSIVLRPQMIRAMWVKEVVNEEKKETTTQN